MERAVQKEPHKISRERPPTQWTDGLKSLITNWMQCAQDRKQWQRQGKPISISVDKELIDDDDDDTIIEIFSITAKDRK